MRMLIMSIVTSPTVRLLTIAATLLAAGAAARVAGQAAQGPGEGQAGVAAAKTDQAAAPAGDVVRGADVYERYGCFQCHANEGQGGTQGPRLGPDPIPYERFARYTRHPTGEMPPYTTTVMSDQDMADVYAFLLARPRPRPVEEIPLLAP